MFSPRETPTEAREVKKSSTPRRSTGTGAGVGTGIGSATAPDKKDEATRAIAARRTNIFSCQRGCEEKKVVKRRGREEQKVVKTKKL